jgi:hypothetical protein
MENKEMPISILVRREINFSFADLDNKADEFLSQYKDVDITLNNISNCKIAKKEVKEKMDILTQMKTKLKVVISPIENDINSIYRKLEDVYNRFKSLDTLEKNLFIEDRKESLQSYFEVNYKQHNLNFNSILNHEKLNKWINKTEKLENCMTNIDLIVEEILKNLQTLNAYETDYYIKNNYNYPLLLVEKARVENMNRLLEEDNKRKQQQQQEQIKEQVTIKQEPQAIKQEVREEVKEEQPIKQAFTFKANLIIQYNEDGKQALSKLLTPLLNQLQEQGIINYQVTKE